MSLENREFRRLMMEAALLDANDAKRLSVEKQIATDHDWAEREWLELIREDEQLKLALRKVDAPSGLENRLLEIPDTIPVKRNNIISFKYAAVAAIFLLGFAGYYNYKINAPVHDELLSPIALMAADDHMNDFEKMMPIVKPANFVSTLSQTVNFAVTLPDFGENYQLLGGRPCKWGDREVVFSRWKHNGEFFSLIQFNPENQGITSDISKKKVCCGSYMDRKDGEVVIWVENGKGFALVGHISELESKIVSEKSTYL